MQARRSLCGADRHGDAWLAGVVSDYDFERHGVSGGNAFRDQDVDLPHSMNEPRGSPGGTIAPINDLERVHVFYRYHLV